MGGCCGKKQAESELSDARAQGAAARPAPQPPAPKAAAQPAPPKPAPGTAAAETPAAVAEPKPLAAWSAEEVGEWLAATVSLPQYREKLAAMGADGFMLSRMEPEDLEDAVPNKADRLAIVSAAKEELAKGQKKSGARQNYGKVLGHDRDD